MIDARSVEETFVFLPIVRRMPCLFVKLSLVLLEIWWLFCGLDVHTRADHPSNAVFQVLWEVLGNLQAFLTCFILLGIILLHSLLKSDLIVLHIPVYSSLISCPFRNWVFIVYSISLWNPVLFRTSWASFPSLRLSWNSRLVPTVEAVTTSHVFLVFLVEVLQCSVRSSFVLCCCCGGCPRIAILVFTHSRGQPRRINGWPIFIFSLVLTMTYDHVDLPLFKRFPRCSFLGSPINQRLLGQSLLLFCDKFAFVWRFIPFILLLLNGLLFHFL